MCTVTFIARRRGYLLGMNRDELLARPVAVPPALHLVGKRQALFPTEPGGGTWIGVNDAGVTFALINWYAVKVRVTATAASRGEVVKRMLTVTTPAEALELLQARRLKATNPFRLIGIFPDPDRVFEWRWNLSRLTSEEHDWAINSWFSSGHDEAGAQESRGEIYRDALGSPSAGSRDWLRRLHRSHGAECGPYSHCMHRHDAATVSYTEVEVTSCQAKVRYLPGNPCMGNLLKSTYVLSWSRDDAQFSWRP